MAEIKRQALNLNKYKQDRSTKAQTNQKQIENQRSRATLPYRKQLINNSTNNSKNKPQSIKGLSKIETARMQALKRGYISLDDQ